MKYYVLKSFLSLSRLDLLRLRGTLRFESQYRLIKSKRFDALIVLDACRYDVFSEIVNDYIDGILQPVVSPASTTIDWLKATFSKGVWKDTIYVSAAPHVNKRGLLKSFNAHNIFLDVVEVWDWGWDEDLLTVPPFKVNLGTKIAMTKARLRGLRFPRDYKLIIHYVQPHAPYIVLRKLASKISKNKELSKKLVDITVRKLNKFTGNFSIDYIILGILKEYIESKEELHRTLYYAYRENMRWVLKHVAQLIPYLNGRTIITADHGELLGEYGLYFHMDIPLPHLRIIPWFTIK